MFVQVLRWPSATSRESCSSRLRGKKPCCRVAGLMVNVNVTLLISKESLGLYLVLLVLTAQPLDIQSRRNYSFSSFAQPVSMQKCYDFFSTMQKENSEECSCCSFPVDDKSRCQAP